MPRPPAIRAAFEGDLVVDNFAGGGGASSGIEAAIGRPVDIAINHSQEAIAMHRANHPGTKHYCEDIWEVDPVEACCGRPVGLAWFSPDCTHHSRAKGGKPKSKQIRALAWVAIRWAKKVRPKIIMLENVEEFATWGPLDKDGHPVKSKAGSTFRAFIGQLSDLGYTVDVKPLVAANYGTPTTRKRLFIIARLNGNGAWPEHSHGEGTQKPWRTAAEIMDWSYPCPSIFGRKRPLAEKTMKRIASGIQRYVIDAAEPFIIPVTHAGGYNRTHGMQLPLPTVTGANRGEFALVSPTLIKYHGGERWNRPFSMDTPIATLDTSNRFGLVATFLSRYFGQSVGQATDKPVPTITAGGGGKTALVSAFLTKYYGSGVGSSIEEPLHTVTTKDRHSLTYAYLTKFYGTAIGTSLKEPLHTVTANGGKFGLVVVKGEQYRIVDIGMRMLQPPELFAAQGFPDDYKIQPWFKGKPMTKTAQVSLAGNAVCPQVAEALVRENMN
jgi:DNA (cytosine-5)-methyltransferase 1